MGTWGWREAADLGGNMVNLNMNMELVQSEHFTLTLGFLSVLIYWERKYSGNKGGYYYLFFKRSGIGEGHVCLEFNPVKDEGSKWLYVMKVESLV